MFGTHYYDQSNRMPTVSTGQAFYFRVTDATTFTRDVSKLVNVIGTIGQVASLCFSFEPNTTTYFFVASSLTWGATNMISRYMEPQAKKMLGEHKDEEMEYIPTEARKHLQAGQFIQVN